MKKGKDTDNKNKEKKTESDNKNEIASNNKIKQKKKDSINNNEKKENKIIKYFKKKGFTLIELLAVIIILGILMIIAIPSVTEYISSSRKSAYVTTAKKYIEGIRNKVNSSEISAYDVDSTYYIPASCVQLENGGESPYGKWLEYYVVVTYDGFGYNYYWTSRDDSNQGIYLTHQGSLNNDSIKTDVKSICTDIGIGDRSTIILVGNSCKTSDAIIKSPTKYIDDNSSIDSDIDSSTNNNAKEGTLVYEMLKEEHPLDSSRSTYVASGGIDFGNSPSDTNGKGLYVRKGTENNSNPVYYYRGEVENNNVIFADMCWKIVRTTETGGIKLIYNGVPTDGTCYNSGEASTIGKSSFSSLENSFSDAGYMYDTAYNIISGHFTYSDTFGNDVKYSNGKYTLLNTISSANGSFDEVKKKVFEKYHYTCLTSETSCEDVYYIYFGDNYNWIKYIKISNGDTIESVIKKELSEVDNKNNSALKDVVDNWYSAKLIDYASKLEDTVWCNDRSMDNIKGLDKNSTANNETLYFNSFDRVFNDYKPSLVCKNRSDRFTVNKSNGNGDLKYPVGLLTVDEIMLAGNGINNNYLNSNVSWWTMTPVAHSYGSSYLNIFFAGFSNSGFSKNPDIASASYSNTSINYVRPSVSLKPGTMINGGDGSYDDPYIIN